jgi:hypothetical protein
VRLKDFRIGNLALSENVDGTSTCVDAWTCRRPDDQSEGAGVMRITTTRCLVFAAIIAGSLGLASSAMAAGTSNNVNGCVSTWGNTGSSMVCTPTVDMRVRNHASCSFSPDQNSSPTDVTRGALTSGFQIDCTFDINSAIPQVLQTF